MTYGFKKAIVWGCPLHQHTNSYIYAGFYKAFKAMGFDAYWLNENSDISGMDFSNTLFLTEWQHAGNMPKQKDCKYVLHNCDPKDYEGLDVLHLQTYTDLCISGTCVHNTTDQCQYLAHGIPEKINNEGSWYAEQQHRRTLFQPWATDLLPEEIDLNWASIPRSSEVNWVGTIGEGVYGNTDEINAFRRACSELKLPFIHYGVGSVGFDENRQLIQRSYIAPAICGTEQCRVGCITCRIFKHISYGQIGATNNKAVHDLFEENTIFNKDCYALFYDTKRSAQDIPKIQNLMLFVKNRHTYINRIKAILEVL